jgi:prevent-host-death family protein
MLVVNVREAKAQLSRILDRVAKGEEIVITKAGRPVAKLVPIPGKPRKPGRCKGKIHVSDDFDGPLPESIMKPFRGESS